MESPLILVVEDESIVAQDIQNTLRKLGYRAPGLAATGGDALAMAVELSPDLVLMDIRLKGPMDGVEAARRILELHDIPVIYLTAYADSQTLERAKLTGPFGYVLKPFEERELQTAIEMALYKHGMERRLQENRHWLSTTLRSIGDAVITTDPAGLITFVNREAESLTGWLQEEAVGHPLRDVFRVIGEQDRLPAEGPLTAVLRDGRNEVLSAQFLLQARDAGEIPVEASASLISGERDDVLGGVLVFRDISARLQAESALRESEESHRRLVEASRQCILVYHEGIVVFINPAGIGLFGAQAAEQVIGRVFFDFVHPDSRSPLREAFLALAAANDGFLPAREERFLRLDGRAIDVEVVAIPILFVGKPSIHVVCQDISERKRLEGELRQSQKMEAVGRLAGGIAHDFNNLLTAIIGYSDLMLSRIDGKDPLFEDIEQVRRAAERAAALTRQLLAFSRRQVLQIRIVDLNASVSEMEKMLARVIGENIMLKTVLAPDLFPVRADLGQLQQVLLNLAINARDAMPDGGELTIRTGNRILDEPLPIKKSVLPTGEYAVVEVADTGCGISPEISEHLFEPFFTTKQPGEGTGLGLSMAYGIVKQCGGDISVSTALDQGSVFTLFLPRAVETEELRIADAIAPVSYSGSGTILLVEDEELVRTLAQTVLGRNGYRVLEAGQGVDALAIAARCQERIDLLITDVVMPGINGVDLSERIRESHPGIKVLFMSGYSEKAVVRLPEQAAFLQKPFSLAELAEKVRAVLEGRAGC